MSRYSHRPVSSRGLSLLEDARCHGGRIDDLSKPSVLRSVYALVARGKMQFVVTKQRRHRPRPIAAVIKEIPVPAQLRILPAGPDAGAAAPRRTATSAAPVFMDQR